MLFMVIERFRNQNANAVYQRFRERGRLAPQGLIYLGSWIEASLDRCFQLMECDDASLLQRWVALSFEIVPVAPGRDTAEALLPDDGGAGVPVGASVPPIATGHPVACPLATGAGAMLDDPPSRQATGASPVAPG